MSYLNKRNYNLSINRRSPYYNMNTARIYERRVNPYIHMTNNEHHSFTGEYFFHRNCYYIRKTSPTKFEFYK